jgi:hypothetical protein
LDTFNLGFRNYFKHNQSYKVKIFENKFLKEERGAGTLSQAQNGQGHEKRRETSFNGIKEKQGARKLGLAKADMTFKGDVFFFFFFKHESSKTLAQKQPTSIYRILISKFSAFMSTQILNLSFSYFLPRTVDRFLNYMGFT